MIRMIQFVAVALILTLASCDGNDSSSWNEEPSEPCEAVGYASHGVGSTWTTHWTMGDDCEGKCEGLGGECEGLKELGVDVNTLETYAACRTAYQACLMACEGSLGHYHFRYHITESVVGRKTYRGRDVVMLETAYESEPEHLAGQVKVALSIVAPEPHIDYIDSCTGNLVATVDDSGITDFAPHDGKLSLPLEVGKTWTATYTITPPGRSSWVATDEWKITSFEEVNTPAGAFMAYRIVDGSSPSRFFYYDPDLALIIKEDSSSSTKYLLSYDLK